MLSLPGVWVCSLVREPGSHKPCDAAKIKYNFKVINSNYRTSCFQGYVIAILPLLGTIKIEVKGKTNFLIWCILFYSSNILKWNYNSHQSGVGAPIQELPL